MRSNAETLSKWKATFGSYEDVDALKLAVKEGAEGSPCEKGLRSVCWKVFLLFHSLERPSWLKSLDDSRGAYASLKQHFMKNIENPEDVTADDLLGDSETSPWTVLHLDEELRAEIWQDVERCMPENAYFREPTTQVMLLDILFIYCKLNRDIGYRQGMHEVLAPILWVVSCDACEPTVSDQAGAEFDDLAIQCLDRTYIEHDAFTLFSIVMRTVKTFYELGPGNESLTSGPVNNSPIVQRSKRIHEYYLQQTDPELAEHLEAIEILPQIFLIRWVRLVFGREFPFEDVLSLWDVLFAEDPELDLVDLISVSMLLRIRWQLLEADYSAALNLLLRYPAPTAPHKAATFVSDALHLRQNLSLDGGDHIISKYSSRAPETTVTRKLPKKVKRARTAEQVAAQKASETAIEPSTPPEGRRRDFKGIDEIIQETAKGLYTQGEKWGVTKALRGAVQGLQSGQVTPRRPLHRSRWSTDSKKSVDTNSTTDLLRKVESLEQRNKSLAQLLKAAMDELWAERKANQNDKDPADDSLNLAIAKVQFVQVYLENPNLSLPTDNAEDEKTAVHQGSHSTSQRQTNDPDIDQSILQPKLDGAAEEKAAATTSSVLLPSPSPPESSAPVAPSTPPPLNEKRTVVGSEDRQFPQQPRPTIAQSPYSWMLGEAKPKSGFVATSPLKPEGIPTPLHEVPDGSAHRSPRRNVKTSLNSGKSTSNRQTVEEGDIFLEESRDR